MGGFKEWVGLRNGWMDGQRERERGGCGFSCLMK
jgi:hypothetical protein